MILFCKVRLFTFMCGNMFRVLGLLVLDLFDDMVSSGTISGSFC